MASEFFAAFYLTPLTESPWLWFIYNMAMWSAVHSLDGVTNTYIIVATLCIISLIAAFGSFYVECPLSWYLETYEFDLPATDFCGFIGLNFQMPRYLFCIATVIILDILTVFRVRQFTERLQATTAPVDKKEKNSKRREMSFLKQTCSQGAVCSWELIACFYLSPMTENLWLLFFFNSVSWVAVHSFDGLATLYFNQDMNKYLKTLIFKRGKVEEVSRTRQSDAMFKVSTASRVIII
uniref:7TM_GPCR_Srx domain-containing protein n=2 Tax=Caenorhabditis tropicalis TaxID=1561998 RepID=A0A1I7UVH0_9PELO